MSGLRGRNNRLAALVVERGLLTSGFRRSLYALAREFADDADEAADVAYVFDEWFGDCCVKPAAYKIRRDGDGIWGVTVEIYEVENSVEISEYKLETYGDLADREGPHFELHILDRYDHEIIVESEELMSFWFLTTESEDDKKLLLKSLRSRATVQHHAPIIVDVDGAMEARREIAALKRKLKDAKTTRAEMRAAYDAVRELGVKI